MTAQRARHGRLRRDGQGGSRKGALVAALGIPLGLIASGALVWQASYAAFTASTTNGANNWTAGTVALSDNDSNTAFWASSTDLKPTDTGTKCLTVTYNGSLTSNVKLFVTSSQAGLRPYLRMTVEESTATVTGGASGDCTGFTTGTVTTLYNNTTTPDDTRTLEHLVTNHGSYANGLSSWQPTGTGQTRSYRITWYVLDNNSAQGQTANATFTWEAQNT